MSKVVYISDGALHLAVKYWNLFQRMPYAEFNDLTDRYLVMAKERKEWYEKVKRKEARRA